MDWNMTDRRSKKFTKVGSWITIGWVLLLHAALLAEEEIRTPSQTIEYNLQRLLDGSNGNGADNPDVREIVDDLFDVERLAPQVLQKTWSKLGEVQQKRFVDALRENLHREVLSELRQHNGISPSSLKLQSENVKTSTATLNFVLSSPKKKKRKFSIKMLKSTGGQWKITDLRSGSKSFKRSYHNYCKKTIDRYFLGYLIADLGDHDYVILEDFEDYDVGKLPPRWKWRGGDDKKNKPYEVREENGNRYLAAEDNGESVILLKELKWNLKKYPYISFKWRAHKIPAGGDERYGRTVDSAAGLYLTYKKKLGYIPVSVKFVWSSTLPVGSAMKRSGIGKPWMVVAESGEDHLGEWRTYIFDARQAYKDTFGGNPPDRPLGLGFLSDANSTHSQAYADYDDIRALKHANVGSGVEKKLKAE
jgi:ABC-type transporter MlaC component